MLRRRAMPVGALLIVLLLALSAVGVGYGLWAETLVIDGTVNTGEVDVGFSAPSVFEWVEVNGVPQEEPPAKDAAAECTASRQDSDQSSDGFEKLVISVVGAYPSYHCEVTFDVTNLGNVPVLVHQPEQTTHLGWVDLEGCYDEDTQLEQGHSAYCTILIHFTNDDLVEENSQYDFDFSILAHQWNEEPE